MASFARPHLIALVFAAACGSQDPPDVSDATETVTATCSVNDLAWNGASTQRCRGAWKYWRHGNCQQRDPSCGAKTVCYTGWNTCANWSFGGTYQYDSNQNVTSFDGNSHAYYVGSVCTEGYYDDSGHYHRPVCRIDTATAN